MSVYLKYELRDCDLYTHEFVIRMTVSGLPPGEVRLNLPAWIPGSYMIRDFARNITEIAATDGCGPLELVKLDKQTWAASLRQSELIVEYRVYAFDLSVRSAYLDHTRAYFNGTSLFLSVEGQLHSPWELNIERPAAEAAGRWRLATSMQVRDVDSEGFGVYEGEGYERLIDSPVEMACLERGRFMVGDVPHEFAVTDGGRFDMKRLCADMARVCAEHVDMFGELPVDRYLFLTLAVAEGYGGLEHRDSTSLICKRSDLPVPRRSRVDKGYRQFLALCSHEYFHLWNVKRICPAQLQASDLSREAYTRLLWAFEGITSYYDELALVRSNVLSTEEYLDMFATTATRVLRMPGRLRQSVAESSFDAWTKFYKQDENAPNAIVSYYAKGALIAFGLDVTLRERSSGAVTLDDLMRLLWKRFGKTGAGVPEGGIEREAASLLGESLDDFFTHYVYGTAELPLEAWFRTLGIGYRARAAANTDDLGGFRTPLESGDVAPALGAKFEVQPVGLRLTQVLAGGAAQAAGLAPGDLLLALDAERVTAANLGDLLRRADGQTVRAHYFRRDRLTESLLPIREASDDTCDLWLLPEDVVGERVLARRTAWLRASRAGDR